METSLAELLLIAAVVYGLYRLLAPFQRFVERTILRALGETPVIDVEPVEPKKKRRKE
jgi:hypothetical protein